MMIRDYQQAEDLTHDTFIKAYKSYSSYKGKSKPKTWLYRIAHNITIDFIRKQKTLIVFKNFFHTKAENDPLPEDIVAIRENSRELYKALGRLKSTYREVIILRKIKNFSIKETSTILKWSDNKVKTTLYRAIPALEKELVKEGFTYEKKRSPEDVIFDRSLKDLNQNIIWKQENKSNLQYRVSCSIKKMDQKSSKYNNLKYASSVGILLVFLLLGYKFILSNNLLDESSTYFNHNQSQNNVITEDGNEQPKEGDKDNAINADRRFVSKEEMLREIDLRLPTYTPSQMNTTSQFIIIKHPEGTKTAEVKYDGNSSFYLHFTQSEIGEGVDAINHVKHVMYPNEKPVEMIVNGNPAFLLLENDSSYYSTLHIVTENYFITLSTHGIEKEEIMKVANSIDLTGLSN
ncbi:RNA polymerase sigma factor [Ornithinibacillus gellani]|nr:RNA polymerase sigma factor [Ornithinibacillus gellani]